MRAWKIAEEIIGEVFLEYRDFEKAIPHFESLKNLCEQQKDYRRKLEAYKQLGFCHQLQKDYKKAVIFYKKVLQLA